jgi:copper(I)-binding protein
MDDGVMKMRKLEKLGIPAGGSALLKPSGDHIMLFGLKAPLKEGDLLPITLVFEKAGEVKIDATIEPVGAKGPHGLDQQPGHEDHTGHNQH